MNKKKRAIIFVICLFLVLTIGIIYIFSELYTESEMPEPQKTDAQIFKEEYESLNNKDLNGKTIRELSISENNPFVYKSAEDIVSYIDSKQSFIVYFGFPTCPWCRSVLPSIIKASEEMGIKTIYYVNVYQIRDKYELNDKNVAVKTVEGSTGYNDLLDRLDAVLDDYTPLTYTVKKKTKKVKVPSKRIYAPNIVVIKEGQPLTLVDGISKKQDDAYMELTDEMQNESLEIFKEAFDRLNTNEECTDTKC